LNGILFFIKWIYQIPIGSDSALFEKAKEANIEMMETIIPLMFIIMKLRIHSKTFGDKVIDVHSYKLRQNFRNISTLFLHFHIKKEGLPKSLSVNLL